MLLAITMSVIIIMLDVYMHLSWQHSAACEVFEDLRAERRLKEGLQKRRVQFRSNTAPLCLHCEAHEAREPFVSFSEMPFPDPESLRHTLSPCACAGEKR